MAWGARNLVSTQVDDVPRQPGRFVSAYEGAASDSFDDLAHLGVAEAKQDESSALVPEKW